jgi:hypothetical protein
MMNVNRSEDIGMRRNLSTPRRAGVTLALVVASIVTACDSDAHVERVERAQRVERVRVAKTSDAVVDSMGMPPSNVSIVASHARPELTENSAAVMSRAQPGVFFTINDSGNDPILFAMDTLGADRGAWPVRGATNVDWESASMGPCGGAPGAHDDCVYIGDTGDNHARYASRAVYRVREPIATRTGDSLPAERLEYVYSDGPHDVEAMYVAPNGEMVFITKRPLRGVTGALRPALVFRIASNAWAARARTVAQLVDSLPIVPGSSLLRLITDASLAPDGRHVAVRTYSQVYLFASDPLSGSIVHSVAPAVCNITSLGEAQGEGVTWATSAGRLVFTSEGQTEPIRLANCSLPPR